MPLKLVMKAALPLLNAITMELVLGVDNTFGPGINLFPNPTKDNVFITFPKNLTDIRISIVDPAGKEQYSASYTPGK